MAADVPALAPAAPPPPPAPAAFDWAGPYVGVIAGAWFALPDGPTFTNWEFAAQAGYNIPLGPVVLGIEGEVGVWEIGGGFSPVYANLHARLGVPIGNRTLGYIEGGVGGFFISWPLWLNLSAGAEFALGDSVTAFGELRTSFDIGDGWIPFIAVLGGLNYHLGN